MHVDVEQGVKEDMVILGIDPGTQVVGYGVVVSREGEIFYRDSGTLTVPGRRSFVERLVWLGRELREVLKAHQPEIAVIEQIFLGKNVNSAFRLGHARGICLYESALAGARVEEYAARVVKKGLTGQGGAGKEQVRNAVVTLLGLNHEANSQRASRSTSQPTSKLTSELTLDASDALAMAYYQAIRGEAEKKRLKLKEATL